MTPMYFHMLLPLDMFLLVHSVDPQKIPRKDGRKDGRTDKPIGKSHAGVNLDKNYHRMVIF